MVYTSMYPDIVDNMCKPSVAKAFPKMKVSWFQGGTENIMTKMNGEIRAKRISTDLLMVADPSYYLTLQKQGLLLPYKAKDFDKVILDKDPQGAWYSVRVCNMIIALIKTSSIPRMRPSPGRTCLTRSGRARLPCPIRF